MDDSDIPGIDPIDPTDLADGGLPGGDPVDHWLRGQEVTPLHPAPGEFTRVTRAARRRKRTTLVTSCAAVLLVAGMSAALARTLTSGGDGGGDKAAAPNPSGTSRGTPRPGAAPGATASGATGSTASGPRTTQTTQSAGVVIMCRTVDLDIGVRQGEGSSGHPGLVVVFTNRGSGPCRISGYPGVSLVRGAAQEQVNEAATRGVGLPSGVVTLAPGRAAQASVQLVQAGNFAEDECRPVSATGVRVFPPDEIEAVVVPTTHVVCSAPGVGVATVYPVQPM